MPPFRLALPGLLLWTPLLSAAAPAMPSDHWSFRPIRRPALPTPPVSPPGKGGIPGGWVRNPIDAFVLARLDKEGLRPSAEADRITLLRRVSLDLVGLPPTPEEVDAFL